MNNKIQKKKVWDQLIEKGLIQGESDFNKIKLTSPPKSDRKPIGDIHPDKLDKYTGEFCTEIITKPGESEEEAITSFLNRKSDE